jgi:AcrR family transcriptional regulator
MMRRGADTQAEARDEVREAILDAVDWRLARFGYRKMTIDELAADARIGKGTVYLHFRSKEEVVLSHVDRIVDRLAVRLEEIAERKDSAAVRLRAMLVERVLFRFNAVQHYTESLNDLLAAIRPALLERRARHFAREAQILSRVVSAGRRSGEFALAGGPDVPRALIEATNSLLPYSLSPQELGNVREVERRVTQIADLLVRGLSANS